MSALAYLRLEVGVEQDIAIGVDSKVVAVGSKLSKKRWREREREGERERDRQTERQLPDSPVKPCVFSKHKDT